MTLLVVKFWELKSREEVILYFTLLFVIVWGEQYKEELIPNVSFFVSVLGEQ